MNKKNRLGIISLLALVTLLVTGCGSTGTVVGGGSSYLDIVNRADASIWYLYISPCSSNSWGDDQLGSDVIIQGETYRFWMTPGCWDLRAETSDGRETERFGVQMGYSDGKTWTISSTRRK